VDLDAMNNSFTKKELVGRTYAGADGYCLELALHPGVQHSAAESQYNFERALPMAASLVSTALLVRADSGFDSLKLYQEIAAQAATLKREIAFIIKWNPRRAPVEATASQKTADASVQWTVLREGKSDLPMRHSAQRRRIRTVIHELMFKAARIIKHAGRWILGLGQSDSGFAVFERHYGQLKTA